MGVIGETELKKIRKGLIKKGLKSPPSKKTSKTKKKKKRPTIKGDVGNILSGVFRKGGEASANIAFGKKGKRKIVGKSRRKR